MPDTKFAEVYVRPDDTTATPAVIKRQLNAWAERNGVAPEHRRMSQYPCGGCDQIAGPHRHHRMEEVDVA